MDIRVLRGIPGVGVLLASLSAVAFASGSLFIKLLSSYHPIHILVIRSILTLIIFTVIVIIRCEDIKGYPSERGWIAFRSIFGIGLTYTSFSSFRLLPLGDASSIIFSSPMFATFIACIVLKEPCGIFEVLVIPFGILGTILISRPSFLFSLTKQQEAADPFTETRLSGTLLALTASLCTALNYVAMRKLQSTSTSVIIFWFNAVIAFVGSIYVILIGEMRLPANWTDVVYFVVCTLASIAGQLFLTIALKIEETGPVSMARTLDVVTAFIFQATLLHEPVLKTTIIGSIIVCSAVILVYIHKWKCSIRSRCHQGSCDIQGNDETKPLKIASSSSLGKTYV